MYILRWHSLHSSQCKINVMMVERALSSKRLPDSNWNLEYIMSTFLMLFQTYQPYDNELEDYLVCCIFWRQQFHVWNTCRLSEVPTHLNSHICACALKYMRVSRTNHHVATTSTYATFMSTYNPEHVFVSSKNWQVISAIKRIIYDSSSKRYTIPFFLMDLAWLVKNKL